jgi:hypothetical protein
MKKKSKKNKKGVQEIQGKMEAKPRNEISEQVCGQKAISPNGNRKLRGARNKLFKRKSASAV